MHAKPKRYEDLERAIDEVAASYGTDAEINNLESAALPNQRAIIQAYRHLKPVLYMGFFSTQALNRINLRQAIAEHLYAAHEILVEQIERALTYERWMGRAARCIPSGSGEEVVLNLFNALPEVRRLLNGDVLASYNGDPAARSFEEVVFSYPSIEAITAYRLAHVLYEARVPMIPRIISEHAHSRTGIDINPGATIGERFFIDHGTGVVIGESAVIGDDVKVYQGVTLGALSVPRASGAQHKRPPDVENPQKRHPTLEDGVTIYAGATILGGDTVIGRGSVVGGNVWLVQSVPPYSKVFGRSRSEDDPVTIPPSPESTSKH